MADTTITIAAASKIDDASPYVLGANRNHVDGGYHWPTYRAGIIDRMKALIPTWGSAKYGLGKWLYRIGHGPTDGRTDKGPGFEWDGYRYESWFGARHNGQSSRYPFDDIKYGLNEAEEMGAFVSMVANMGSSSLPPDVFPNETGRMAAYCNKTTNTQRRDHNATRYNDASKPNNGRYDVVWWEMGNEMSMSWELGHSSTTDPTYNRAPDEITYAKNAAKMALAIRNNSDIPVKIGMLACTNFNWTGNGWTDGGKTKDRLKILLWNIWDNAVLNATLQCDAIIFHGYPSWPITADNGTNKRVMSVMTWQAQRLQWLQELYTEWKAANPGIAAPAEMMVWDSEGHTDQRRQNGVGTNIAQGFIGAMYGFDRIITAMREKVQMVVQFCMWHRSGSDLPYDNLLFVDGYPDRPTALYKAMKLLAANWGSEIVEADTDANCPTIFSQGSSTPYGDVTYKVLATVAAKDADNLYLLVLNRSETHNVTFNLATFNWTWTPATDLVGVHKIRCTGATADGHYNENATTYHTAAGNSEFTAEPMSIQILVIPNSAASPPPVESDPEVYAVEPDSGYVGDSVVIQGASFSAAAGDHTIDFNGTPTACTGVNSSRSELTATVPPGASSGPVGVTIAGVRYETPPGAEFTVLQLDAPQLTGISPSSGPPGTKVTITGTNLRVPSSLEDTVIYHQPNMAWSHALEHDNDKIVFRVPEGATTGTLTVMSFAWDDVLETAAEFTVTEPFLAGPAALRAALGNSLCRLYVDSQPVDGGEPYWAAWQEIDWGSASEREPSLTQTAGGTYVVFAMETAMEERTGRLTIFAEAKDVNHKRGVASTLSRILSGSRRIHHGSRYLDVFLSKPREVQGASRQAPTMVGIEADFIAPDPLWRLNQPLNGIEKPVNEGVEYSLYDDETVPVELPDYKFKTSRFYLENWGTAWTFGAGSITNGPANSRLYLRGPGQRRVEVRLDANGFGRFTEGAELYLAVGSNLIRVEHEDGTLFGPTQGFTVSFGDTTMRFL